MPIKPDREYRGIVQPFRTQTGDKKLDSQFYVEGYATTFDKPYLLYEYDGIGYYEMIARSALDGADLSDVIMQYDHTGKVFARVSNRTLGVEPDNYGLYIYADLSKSNAAQDMHQEISSGLVTRMSWAFTVLEESYNQDTRTRTILKIKKVYDVSAVSIPANADTEISARTWVDGVVEQEKQEMLKRKLELSKAKYFYLGGTDGN